MEILTTSSLLLPARTNSFQEGTHLHQKGRSERLLAYSSEKEIWPRNQVVCETEREEGRAHFLTVAEGE